MFLVLSSSVFSVTPFAQLSDVTTDIQIAYPKADVLMINGNFNTHFHIFNSTSFILTNATTDCYMHLYSLNGSHIFEKKASFSSNKIDYEVEINTSPLHNGIYPYVIWCNNSLEGGFVSGTLEMTHNGKEANPLNMFAIIFGLLSLSIVMISIGVLLNEEHAILKFLLYGASLFLMLYVPKVMFDIYEVALTTNIIVAYTWILRLFTTYLFLYYFVYQPMVKWGWIGKNEK